MKYYHFNSSISWRLLVICLSLLLLGGCTDHDSIVRPSGRTQLVLSATLPENAGLRATGTSWDEGDKIGVFAINNRSSLSASSIINGYENLAYTTNGTGLFTPTDVAIELPLDGTVMDLVSYYPFKQGLTDYSYPIDLKKQEDIFYSRNAVGVGVANSRPQLQFSHVLSRLKLTIASTSGASLDGIIITVEDTPLEGVLSLVDGKVTASGTSNGSLPMTLSGATGTSVVAQALLLPGSVANALSVKFVIGKQTFSWKIPAAMESGKYYEYNIKLDKVVHASEIYHGLPEIPQTASGAAIPHTLYNMHLIEDQNWLRASGSSNTQKRNYTMLYNTQERVPYWVAYPLHPVYLGNSGRSGSWDYDPMIPRSLQPRVEKSWVSDYDRGHLLASADRTASRQINQTTFYFTNQAPQYFKMNQGTWNQLESKVREWCMQTAKYDTLYVVTGCILPLSPEKDYIKVKDNDGKLSVVPRYYYKALMRQNKSTHKYSTIVFCVKNAEKYDSYLRSIISVEELEHRTGFKFFPTIPAEQATAKQNTSMAEWR